MKRFLEKEFIPLIINDWFLVFLSWIKLIQRILLGAMPVQSEEARGKCGCKGKDHTSSTHLCLCLKFHQPKARDWSELALLHRAVTAAGSSWAGQSVLTGRADPFRPEDYTFFQSHWAKGLVPFVQEELYSSYTIVSSILTTYGGIFFVDLITIVAFPPLLWCTNL